MRITIILTIILTTATIWQSKTYADSSHCVRADAQYSAESTTSYPRLRVTVSNNCSNSVHVKVCIQKADDRWHYGSFELEPADKDYYEAYEPMGYSSYEYYVSDDGEYPKESCD